MRHTDLLLIAGAAVGRRAQRPQPGRNGRAAIAWDLDTSGVAVLRANVAEALTRDGRVAQASAVVDPVTEGDVSVDRWSIHARRAQLDALCRPPEPTGPPSASAALETSARCSSAMESAGYLAVLRA